MPDVVPDFEDAKNEMKQSQRDYTMLKFRFGLTDAEEPMMLSAIHWKHEAQKQARWKRFFLITTLSFGTAFIFELLKR